MRKRCWYILMALSGLAPVVSANQISVGRVDLMPNHPQPYAMRDWARVARDYDAFVFDEHKTGEYLPILWWDNTRHNYDFPGFGMPSYVGTVYEARDDQHESINCIAAVVGATLVGIDKSHQGGHDFVRMCEKYFNRERGINLYLNNCAGGTGGSFWYETYPSILFGQLFSLYPNTPGMEAQMRISADRLREGILALGGDKGVPNFNHTAFSYESMKPIDNGLWTEPDGAAAYAWFEYMTYVRTGEAKYLEAADLCMRFLDKFETNPYYESLLPHGAYLAARMNAELGRRYDVRKLVNYCFGPTTVIRHGWGVIAEKWGTTDAYGLTGSTPDGYAFCMNTYNEAAALAPLVRYDHRYARAIGKYLLNAANSSRLFFPNAYADDAQTSAAWAHKYDPASCIGYEGCRRRGRATAVPDADFRTAKGRIASGDVSAIRKVNEINGRAYEVLEECPVDGKCSLDHVWTIALKPSVSRWIGASAHTDGGTFRFSYATSPDGPWAPLFAVDGADDRQYGTGLPCDFTGTCYLRAESTGGDKPARLSVDGLWVIYEFESKSPYGMGDVLTGMPTSSGTDLGLYGSSHVGYLGGIVATTNVPEILRVDLLKTDWFHGPAYPTYLYFNPYDKPKSVAVAVGSKPVDLYETVSGKFLARGVKGSAQVAIPADSASVVVFAPAGGKLTRSGNRTLIQNVAVNYCWPALTITSPTADAWLSGRAPVVMKADPCSDDPITRIRATLDEKEIYSGGRVPDDLAIDTTRYADGKHVLTVRVDSVSGAVDELSVPVYFLNGAGGALWANGEAIAAWEPFPGAGATATLKYDLAILTVQNGTWGAVQSPFFDLDLDRGPMVLLDVQDPSRTWWFKIQLEGRDPWYLRGDTTEAGHLSADIVRAVRLLQPEDAGFLTGKTRARLILGPSGKVGATVALRSLWVIYQR